MIIYSLGVVKRCLSYNINNIEININNILKGLLNVNQDVVGIISLKEDSDAP